MYFLHVLNLKQGELERGFIADLQMRLTPLKKDGWRFNWSQLRRTEGAVCYRLSLVSHPDRIEGAVMLSVYFDEMVVMNNLELAPWNVGKSKEFDFVAGCLIAYACEYSFLHGKGNYQGFLTFDSKTELIAHYSQKYGAIKTLGNRMYIDPVQGQHLISSYLIQQ